MRYKGERKWSWMQENICMTKILTLMRTRPDQISLKKSNQFIYRLVWYTSILTFRHSFWRSVDQLKTYYHAVFFLESFKSWWAFYWTSTLARPTSPAWLKHPAWPQTHQIPLLQTNHIKRTPAAPSEQVDKIKAGRGNPPTESGSGALPSPATSSKQRTNSTND